MGHREDLLAGAKRCLYERGYAHTTARDIVAASGTNLASIGYHFGSKEALLNAAFFEMIEEWSVELRRALGDADLGATLLERFERFWTRVINAFAEQRPLWLASFEVFLQAERVPEIRATVAQGLHDGRMLWAGLLQDIDPADQPQAARAVGSFYQALLTGVLTQWLLDPPNAPSAADLTAALRLIAGQVGAETRAGPAQD